MNSANDTNMTVSGSGTASDPKIFHFHATDNQSYETPWMFYAVVIAVLGLATAVGFLLGFCFGKRRTKPN